MAKYKIHPTRVSPLLSKTSQFSFGPTRSDKAFVTLSPDGDYSLQVSGWEDDYVLEYRTKGDRQYKSAILKMSNEMFNEYKSYNEFFSDMSKRAFQLSKRKVLESERDKIEIEHYQPKDCPVEKPKSEEVLRTLEVEANAKYYKSESKDYDIKKHVNINKESVIQERMSCWQEIKKLHDDIEQANANNVNKIYAKAYQEKRRAYDDVIEGTADIVEKKFSDIQSLFSVPYYLEVDYEYIQQDNLISIDVELQDELELIKQIIPSKKAELLASGRISIKNKLQREILNETTDSLLSLLYYVASFAFSISPNIEICRVSLWTNHKEKGYCWIEFSRKKFASISAPTDVTVIWPSVCQLGEYRGANILILMDKVVFKDRIQNTIKQKAI